jgi:hypothetical protein
MKGSSQPVRLNPWGSESVGLTLSRALFDAQSAK